MSLATEMNDKMCTVLYMYVYMVCFFLFILLSKSSLLLFSFFFLFLILPTFGKRWASIRIRMTEKGADYSQSLFIDFVVVVSCSRIDPVFPIDVKMFSDFILCIVSFFILPSILLLWKHYLNIQAMKMCVFSTVQMMSIYYETPFKRFLTLVLYTANVLF